MNWARSHDLDEKSPTDSEDHAGEELSPVLIRMDGLERVLVLAENQPRTVPGREWMTWTYAAPPTVTRSWPSTANRIVMEELEAWNFGDWEAVRAAYPRVSKGVPRQVGYRDPDAIAGRTWEAFERIMKRSGYFTLRRA